MPSSLWNDCEGGVITTELVLVASVLTATLLTGLGSFRNHIQTEFQQIGQSLHQAADVHSDLHSKRDANPQIQPSANEIPGTIFAGDLDSFFAD